MLFNILSVSLLLLSSASNLIQYQVTGSAQLNFADHPGVDMPANQAVLINGFKCKFTVTDSPSNHLVFYFIDCTSDNDHIISTNAACSTLTPGNFDKGYLRIWGQVDAHLLVKCRTTSTAVV